MLLGNGVVGIQRESSSKWERRAPLTPAHCAQLLHAASRPRSQGGGVKRIIVQPCTKRVYHDVQYENVGCHISDDLSECGLILGVKQPQSQALLPERAYAFFSHTHKAQPENMPLLDEVLAKKISLYDYERIVGEKGERLVAFGEYAGRAGMIDFLRGLGERYLSLGYSTPFLSIGSSYMYSSLSAAKAAVLAAGDEIRSSGLPSQLSPLVFVFTGTGNVSRGAQEIFRLLPHTFVDASELPKLQEKTNQSFLGSKGGTYQVYGCVVSAEHMVSPNDPEQGFDKANYYAHPEQYHSVFHETIAPYASVIVNCIYWETRYPRLLTNKQLQKLLAADGSVHSRLAGFADISCDIGGSIECVNCTTSIEKPFYRYDPVSDLYFDDMDGKGIIILATDNLPTELAKESTNHFGDVLLPFITNMANASSISGLMLPVQQACIAHGGQLASLYEYIHRMRLSNDRLPLLEENVQGMGGNGFKTMVSLDGHLFDQRLINEALDVIERAGGQFHLATCELGQTVHATSHAELEVTATSQEALSNIIDMLAAIAERSQQRMEILNQKIQEKQTLPKGIVKNRISEDGSNDFDILRVLIIGAGRMCEPAVKYLAQHGLGDGSPVSVIVASLFLEDAVKVIEGVPNTSAIQLDVSDKAQLYDIVTKVSIVLSLLPPAYHTMVANCCIEAGKHLVTASYVSKEMSALDSKAKRANITLLCEMGLDPGIDHMMAMKMINTARLNGGSVRSFTSYCGGLPSPSCANNPLGYKFSWNPAGALRAGLNAATYKQSGTVVSVPGNALFSSAVPVRFPDFPAFALERLPNRDSLEYGELYDISEEASTIFRATLRYEGFSEIMNSLAKLGFFNSEPSQLLQQMKLSESPRPSYVLLLKDLMLQLSKAINSAKDQEACSAFPLHIDDETLIKLGCCKGQKVASRTLACIRYLGLDTEDEMPNTCESPFDALCSRMEKKLSYSPDEQDMVLLHHEMEIVYKDGRPSEKHVATLMEYGDTAHSSTTIPYRQPQSAMARTVGIPAAIAAQLLLQGKIKSRGVIRPLDPEIYVPALEILETTGIHMEEHVQRLG